MKAKILNECFAELVKHRNWYENTGVNRKTAYRDKKYFENGELSENKIRFYLSHAGYKLYQPEMWINKKKTE